MEKSLEIMDKEVEQMADTEDLSGVKEEIWIKEEKPEETRPQTTEETLLKEDEILEPETLEEIEDESPPMDSKPHSNTCSKIGHLTNQDHADPDKLVKILKK
jgi:hypothetical protein